MQWPRTETNTKWFAIGHMLRYRCSAHSSTPGNSNIVNEPHHSIAVRKRACPLAPNPACSNACKLSNYNFLLHHQHTHTHIIFFGSGTHNIMGVSASALMCPPRYKCCISPPNAPSVEGA
eukprot:1159292-Pelagomonas_calceolata.AAC.4